MKSLKENNCKCSICGKEMHVKPFRLKRVKNGITCSKTCKYELKSIYMSGTGNHQFGVKGELNNSFIGRKRINQYGYVMIYLPNHPKCDTYGRYREHRYVVEQSNLFPDIYFEMINNQRVLKDCFEPHHKDGIKTNNAPNNLVILTRSQHTSLHNNYKKIIRNKTTGKIIGVLKQGELLENPEEDNQQPSLESNFFEGSTTNSQIQTDNSEDGNANTSALPFTIL